MMFLTMKARPVLLVLNVIGASLAFRRFHRAALASAECLTITITETERFR
jgi:hypothetical protein